MIVLDYVYSTAFRNEFPRNKIQLVANLKNEHIDYIFLGSSRVENHIDCGQIENLTGKSCINLGLQGGRFNDYRVLISLLKENRVTFEKMLVQLDYSYNLNDYSPAFLANLVPFVGRDDFPKKIKEELNLPIAYKIPFIRFASNDKLTGIREMILQYAGKEPSNNLSNGFKPLQGIGTAVSVTFPKEIANNNDELDAIQSINENIIFFTAPYCKNTANRDAYMDALTERYPKLKNYIAIFDDQEQYYSNCGHLNKEGAERFTEVLTQEILLD
ncbi:hypothetical protein [Dokdonia sinensis]|nr:hypothetical protein [Dokdonia sinensis]